MIVARLYRGYNEVMDIHELPTSGKYAFDVTKQGHNDNANWSEMFDTFDEAIKFAHKYGWRNLDMNLIER